MKNKIYFLILLLYTISCGEYKKERQQHRNVGITDVKNDLEKLDFDINSKENLRDWLRYYQNEVPGFSLNEFELQRVDTLDFVRGNVRGSFHPEFAEVYYDFLVYNKDSAQYIDFDSYQWSLGEHGEIIRSPDQEINVVDLKEQTVTRIGFRGPSYWVENAFWENDSTVVLLENSSEKQPTIHRLNMENREVEIHVYQDTLTFQSAYSERRLKKKGIVTD